MAMAIPLLELLPPTFAVARHSRARSDLSSSGILSA